MTMIAVPRLQPSLQRVVSAPVEVRVISCHALLPAGGGLRSTYTPSVGNDIRLLSVDVWTMIESEGVDKAIGFEVLTGQGVADTWEEILKWEKVVPVFERQTAFDWWTFWNQGHYRWEMHKRYVGEARRFGLYVEGITTVQAHIYASFQVAEG